MAAAGPTAIPTPSVIVSGGTQDVIYGGRLHDANHNDLWAEVVALWTTVGVSPSGNKVPGEGQVPKGLVDNTTIWDLLGLPSLVPNGGQEIWDATSFTIGSAATDTPTVPGWSSRREHASDTLVVSQESTIIDSAGGGRFSAKLVKTGSNGLASHRLYLPARLVNDWRGRTATIRGRVRQGVASNTRVSLNDGSLHSGAAIATTGAFNTLTLTQAISASATAIWLGVEVGANANAADTVYVDNLSVSWGSVPSIYVPPPMPPIGVLAHVYHNANQSIANSTLTGLAMNSERFDTDGIHDTVTNNSRLTCQSAGFYLIVGSVSFAANATGGRDVQIRLNGSTIIADEAIPSAGAALDTTISARTIQQMAVGDFVDLMAFQTSGGALNALSTANPYSPEFMMVRVG